MQGEATFLARASSGATSAPTHSRGGRRLQSLAVLLSTVVIGGLVLSAIGIWRFGSLAYARAYLQGYSIVPESAVIDVGEVESGIKVTARTRLTNLTRQPIRVVGAESSCGCIAYDDLPIDVPPHESAVMSAYFTSELAIGDGGQLTEGISGQVGNIVNHQIRLYLDIDSPEITLTIRAKVLAKDKKGGESDLLID